MLVSVVVESYIFDTDNVDRIYFHQFAEYEYSELNFASDCRRYFAFSSIVEASGTMSQSGPSHSTIRSPRFHPVLDLRCVNQFAVEVVAVCCHNCHSVEH